VSELVFVYVCLFVCVQRVCVCVCTGCVCVCVCAMQRFVCVCMCFDNLQDLNILLKTFNLGMTIDNLLTAVSLNEYLIPKHSLDILEKHHLMVNFKLEREKLTDVQVRHVYVVHIHTHTRCTHTNRHTYTNTNSLTSTHVVCWQKSTFTLERSANCSTTGKNS